MLKIQADYIFPINQNPIKKGIILCEKNGTINDIIAPENIDYNIENTIFYDGIICPGFINSHCHLELSYLKNKLKPYSGLHNFIIDIQKNRKTSYSIIEESIYLNDAAMFQNGVVAVADVCNSINSFETKTKSKIYYHNLIEIFGSDSKNANLYFDRALSIKKKAESLSLISSVTPHSFYAVSEELLKIIVKNNNSLLSIHHLESDEEKLYFKDKTGKIPQRMNLFGVDISGFIPSGKTPLETYYKHLPIHAKKVLVHNTFCNENDIDFINKKLLNTYLCICPNSNLYIENKLPDVNLFLYKNSKLTIGTDSLASNYALNMVDELFTLQNFFNIDLNMLIKCGSLNGAELLKINNKYGTLSKNKTPGLVNIKNVDLEFMKLTKKSEAVRVL